MKVMDLQQRTPEWLRWRKDGVTASDCAALFGQSRFKTRWQLWAEKSGLRAEDDPEGNPFVRRGREFEHMLRELVVTSRKVGLLPVCVECESNPVLRASLDAIDDRRRPWEFKIPSRRKYGMVKKDGLASEVVQDYVPQIQHQMICTGASEGFMVFGDLDDEAHPPRFVDYTILVVPADAAFQARIVEEAMKFREEVLTGTPPEKDPERDVFAPTTHELADRWTRAAGDMLPLLGRKAAIEAQLDAIKSEIAKASEDVLDIMGDNRVGEFAGLRVTKVTRTGAIDWARYAQAKGDDPKDEAVFAPFRKKESSHHQFRALT